MINYTKVEITFVPAVLDTQDNPLNSDTNYTIEIITPSSSKPGVQQTIPQTIIKSFVLNVPIVLQLVPSDYYLPLGIYTVNYRRVGHKNPIWSERWVVPSYPTTRSVNYVLNPTDTNGLVLPTDFYGVSSLTGWSTSFTTAVNQIIFNTLPSITTQVKLEYVTKVTRDKLLYKG